MIPYSRQHVTDDDIAAVTAVLKSDLLTTGPLVLKFEEALCALTGAKHAIAVSNGTTALHLACLALGVGPGDCGITSPITFLASANCVEYCGGRGDFADIDPETLCLSPKAIEEHCLFRGPPKVVLPVDYAGIPAALPELKRLADKYGFKIIEDAAHSIGSTYTHDGREFACGSCAHADLATFSFHPVKNITTGEGGAVLTNSDALAHKLRLLRSHGMTKDPAQLTRQDGPWYYEMHTPGYNYRLTDIQCALGLSQLNRLPAIKEERQKLVKEYNSLFAGSATVKTPPWPQNTSPCFHLYPVRFTGGAVVRKRVHDALLKNDIRAQVHYFPVHLQPYYSQKYRFAPGSMPVAEHYYESCLSLPLYPGLTPEEVRQVAKVVIANAV